MKSDIEIAKSIQKIEISELLERLHIDNFESFGKYKAKLDLSYSQFDKDSKVILVTSINPTPLGEGKTTMNIALSMALNKIGKNAVSTLREPSLGPSFGLKGGACGGGYCQVLPMDEINLHFTGDFHAITSSVNLVSALIDNHIYQSNDLNIDPTKIVWKRVLDLNDRSLREVVIGLGKRTNGITRQDGFDITVASEMMAVFCLSESLDDFRNRVSKMIVAYTYDDKPVYVEDLNATGAVMALMKDALKPNIVQTTENTPAIIHGGPFANIAHGCNSIIATNTSTNLFDYVVTEAGFGADLGAEKFLDIKCRKSKINPSCAVVVASIRALKYHGSMKLDQLSLEGTDYLRSGFKNLLTHIENLRKYNLEVIVCINKFESDHKTEIELLKDLLRENNTQYSLCEAFTKGSEGALDLAEKVCAICDKDTPKLEFIYDDEEHIKEKIEKVCKEIYRAKSVVFSKKASKEIEKIEKLGKTHFPVCIAKTQYSLSDDPTLLNPTESYEINIQDIRLNNGAEFIVCITQNILTMPGLPKKPAANVIDVDVNNEIIGLF